LVPQDPTKFPEGKFKDAFLAAIHEYNSYGLAEFNVRFRFDETAQLQLYGFKAT
jgi:hypothetical protein